MPGWEIGAGTTSGLVLAAGLVRSLATYGYLATFSAEADAQIEVNESYILEKLFLRVTANATTASSTIRSRKNGANGGQSVSVGAGLTGVFEDASGSDSLTSGDLFNGHVTVGAGGSLTLSILSFLLTHLTDNVPILGAGGVGSATATRYFSLGGSLTSVTATETASQYSFRASATLSNFRIRVSSNGRTDSTIFRTRINDANGNQSISVAASTTGFFEDTTNTDAIVSGDEVNGQFEITAGSGTITFTSFCAKSASAGYQAMVGNPSGLAINADGYITAQGRLFGSATEADAQRIARSGFVTRNMMVNVSAHGASNGVNIFLRKNGANSALTVNVPSATTGFFEDTANSVSFVDGDTYNYFLDHGGGAGSCTLTIIGFELAQPAAASAFVPKVIVFG